MEDLTTFYDKIWFVKLRLMLVRKPSDTNAERYIESISFLMILTVAKCLNLRQVDINIANVKSITDISKVSENY